MKNMELFIRKIWNFLFQTYEISYISETFSRVFLCNKYPFMNTKNIAKLINILTLFIIRLLAEISLKTSSCVSTYFHISCFYHFTILLQIALPQNCFELLHPILKTPETGYWDRLWAEVIKIIAWNQGIGNKKNWEIFRTTL